MCLLGARRALKKCHNCRSLERGVDPPTNTMQCTSVLSNFASLNAFFTEFIVLLKRCVHNCSNWCACWVHRNRSCHTTSLYLCLWVHALLYFDFWFSFRIYYLEWSVPHIELVLIVEMMPNQTICLNTVLWGKSTTQEKVVSKSMPIAEHFETLSQQTRVRTLAFPHTMLDTARVLWVEHLQLWLKNVDFKGSFLEFSWNTLLVQSAFGTGCGYSLSANVKSSDVTSRSLLKVKKPMEAYMCENVTNVVITVLTYFKKNQRQSTIEAVKLSGWNVLPIMNGPMAAATADCSDK
ncbi:molecular chaperone DnaK [Echinococcus multilocularis]|uniref:Molecular chaperone DnaK n=1 Tax=Echinococcus multilocularis TaxID=6211 RepID=A0A0S4MHU9_ECHMU|nr:molecular chaperone DnaK [Echinococcus multilocularis]